VRRGARPRTRAVEENMVDANKQSPSSRPMSVPIGFGCGGLGNLYEPIPEAVADETLAEAWRVGYRYFDTSPFYGYGLSELRVGRLLRSAPREEFILSTKVGRYITPLHGRPLKKLHWAAPLELRPEFDYSYDGVMRSIEQSIIRLGFERIDIFLIHDLDRWTHGEAFSRVFATAMEGAYWALDELRRHGHVKAIGVGVNEADVASDFIRAGDFDCIMLAGRYTLLDQSALDEFLPLAASRGVDVFMAGVFNSGVLARPEARGVTYDYAAASDEIVSRARRIAAICEEFKVPLQAAAIQFPRGHAAVRTVVLGMSKPDRIQQNMNWFSMTIPPALWTRLKAERLIREDAPLPA
jgi:D-threo-aldose 1-dehydrogenase